MSAPQRRLLFLLPACGLLAAVLAWGLLGMPDFGSPPSDLGRYFNQHAPAHRHASNVVAAIVFDYRGWDTAGEELIMFASVMGTALLLRTVRDEGADRRTDVVWSETLRTVGVVVVPTALLVGLWTIAFGYVTPGGGFQGGVIAGSAALLVWVTRSYRDHRRLTPGPLVDASEGLGAMAYLALGLVGLATGTAYLDNVLPLGTLGALASTGTIALLNGATGLEVAAASVLIFHEFLEEYVLTLPSGSEEPGEGRLPGADR